MIRSLTLSSAAVLLLVSSGAWADHGIPECNLNHAQVRAGWSCQIDQVVTNQSLPSGITSACRDRTITTTTYQGVNPAGRADEDRYFEPEPVVSNWGAPYAAPNGCNFDIVP